MEDNPTTGKAMPEASRCAAAGEQGRSIPCCCSRPQRPVWRTRRGLQPLAEAVEQAALAILRDHKPDRPLATNVEFYTALLLEALGFAPQDFTCVFAMGRTLGWLAHAREQVLSGRLIRPASVYIGPAPQKAA